MKKRKEQSTQPQAQAIGTDEMMPILRESIAAGGSVTIPVRGVSMLPILKEGRDSVILSPIEKDLRKRDIVLYQRADGSYILHRIARLGESYTCIGDAQFVFEKGIAPSQMIAVVTAIRRGEREIRVTDPFYRLGSALWCASRSLRYFAKRVKRKLCRMLGIKK